jgi:hypothetical protein
MFFYKMCNYLSNNLQYNLQYNLINNSQQLNITPTEMNEQHLYYQKNNYTNIYLLQISILLIIYYYSFIKFIIYYHIHL